jgi:hypothetical protein
MIKQDEKRLFDQWKDQRRYSSFMADGLFDEKEWNLQSLKILYVLKEANWENGNEDLCEYLLSEKSPTYWKTWNNIARWTQAIRTGGAYPWTVTKKDKTNCLKTIAALNIKKVGGGPRASSETIRQYGKSDAGFINRQIELYQPDVIICCGRGNGKNADILYQYVFPTVSAWQPPIAGYNYFLCTLSTGKRIPVVSFRHPQIRGGHKAFMKYYCDMLTIANELRSRHHLP